MSLVLQTLIKCMRHLTYGLKSAYEELSIFTMGKCKTIHVGHHKLTILDTFMTQQDLTELNRTIAQANISRGEADSPATRHIRQWKADIDPKQFHNMKIAKKIYAAINEFTTSGPLKLKRTYVNFISYGDQVFTHRDSPKETNDTTFLVFANPVWKPAWAGETLFFDAKNDAVAAVTPRPGRALVFDSALLHRAGVPSRVCFPERRTFVCKFASEK